jgi:hypothetical protein
MQFLKIETTAHGYVDMVHMPQLSPYFVILLLDSTLNLLKSLGAHRSHSWECKKV